MMLQQALILSSHREYAQSMRQALLKLGDSRTRIDVEINALRALQLAPHAYELVLLDLVLDSMDGVQMMQLLKQHNPAARFVLVADASDENSRALAYRSGADLFLDRPKTPEALDEALRTIANLVEPRRETGPLPIKGEPPVMAIADIVQMRCLSGDSVLLSVRSQFQSGEIFIFRGEVYHAQYPGKSGEAAFRDMITWDGGLVKIRAVPLDSTPPRTIEASYRQLLNAVDPENPRPLVEQEGGELYAVQGDMPPPSPNLSVMKEAPPLEEAPPPAFPDLRPKRRGATPLPRVNSHWMVNLSGDLLEGSQVADAERCAFITTFIYRKMADVAVALELDYFDHLTLLGPHLQQMLVADNLAVRHAVFDAAWTTEEMRIQYVKWCCEQSF